jgi:hypothetical protein
MITQNVRFRSSLAQASAWTFLLTLCATTCLAQKKADLSRLVVVGDSLSAGYQNNSLLDSQQIHGYASLVAGQAGVALPLPLIAAPGLPNVLTLVSAGPPPVIAPAPGSSPGRDDYTVLPMNLSVPGYNVRGCAHHASRLPN